MKEYNIFKQVSIYITLIFHELSRNLKQKILWHFIDKQSQFFNFNFHH